MEILVNVRYLAPEHASAKASAIVSAEASASFAGCAGTKYSRSGVW